MTADNLKTGDTMDLRKQVLIRVPRLHEHDATSLDVLIQCRVLRQHGWQVWVTAKSKPDLLEEKILSFSEAKKIARNPNVICINHYTGFDSGLFSFRNVATGPFIFRYHNVTPSRWFLRYSVKNWLYALLGRLQVTLFMLTGRCHAVASASKFSLSELLSLILSEENPKTCVLPVFLRSFLSGSSGVFKADSKATSQGPVTAIVVGRVVPSKGIHHLPLILENWREHGFESRGRPLQIKIIGKESPEFVSYKSQVLEAAKRRGVASHLEFMGEVSDASLAHWYKAADVLLSVSEHEGFCVPLIEAQAFGVPIVAINRGAVVETLGEQGGVVISGKPVDYNAVVCAIAQVTSDTSTRVEVIAGGFKNLQRFSEAETTRILLNLLNAVRPKNDSFTS